MNFTMLYNLGWILELSNSSLIQFSAKIPNVFHLGNLLNEFHHVLQFWLNFRIVQFKFNPVFFKMNFIMLYSFQVCSMIHNSCRCNNSLVLLDKKIISEFQNWTWLVTDRVRAWDPSDLKINMNIMFIWKASNQP